MDTPRGELPYRHAQTSYATLIGLAAGAAAQTAQFFRDLVARRRRAWLYLPSMALLGTLMYAFSTLTVEVREDELEAYFTGGLARRRIAVGDITAAETTRTSWLAGWGIRFTTNGWLYNAWGRDAVMLTLAGGGRFTIGTDEPDTLLEAIEEARPRAAAPAA